MRLLEETCPPVGDQPPTTEDGLPLRKPTLNLNGETGVAHNINNNHVSELEEHLRRRNVASSSQRSPSPRHLSPARRDRSPSPLSHCAGEANRQALPETVFDRLKALTVSVQVAEENIHDVQSALKATLLEARAAARVNPAEPTATALSGEGEGKRGGERDKEFIHRNALLSDLFAISHISTIYHIAVVVLIVLVVNTLVHDLTSTGSVQLGFDLIWFCFGGFHRVITIWLVMFFSECVLYACFSYWAERRRNFSNPTARRCFDCGALAALALYYAALVALPVLRLQRYDMKIASTFTVCMECVRMLMKTHAFVRSNVPRALAAGAGQQLCPGFSQFLYFMFAPTLIYRDSYPRTTEIRWRVVACHALEVAGVIFYLSFLCERYLLPLYRDFGKTPPSVLGAVEMLAAGVLSSGMTFVCSFYLLLHSWQDAFAEMLRFGDRLFYKDWWNQTSFSAFYRTWNNLVQDWLFTYVYKDVRLLGGSNSMAKLTVFCISAIVHEFILSFTFGFFFPVLYILFGIIGTAFGFMRYRHPSKAVGNIFLWCSLFAGSSMLFGFYSIEYFARQNCTKLVESSWDLFIPRSFNCVPK